MRRINGILLLTALLMLITGCPLSANPQSKQEFTRNIYIQPVIQYGGIWAHRSVLEVFSSSWFPWFELNVGHQSTGREKWEQLYNYPSLGLGISRIDPGHEALGQATSLFGYTDIRLTRHANHSSGIKLAIGLGYFNTVYDKETNPLNVAISTNLNLYFNLAYLFNWQINDHFSFRAGGGLMHFSNGAFKKPNRGLNIVQATAGVRYRFSPEYRFFEDHIEPADTKHGLTIVASGGVMQPSPEMPNYGVHSLSLNATRQFNHQQRWGVGFDLFYNEYVSEELTGLEMPDNLWQTMRKGVFLSHDLIFKNTVVVANLGFYLPHEISPPQPYYQRIGLRYYIGEGTLFNLSLVAHRGRAEVVEWGIGHSF